MKSIGTPCYGNREEAKGEFTSVSDEIEGRVGRWTVSSRHWILTEMR